MSKVTDGSYGSHGVPVGADWVVGVKASGPNVKELLLSDLRQFTNMAQATGTDADTTMAVNTLYTVDMSAWATADRTYTLPATAAVGDRIGVMVTAGDASHELKLTAGTGDTLNGIAGGTEWSRLFITNEIVVMRCVVANTTWVVEVDRRIPSVASVVKTSAQSISTGSFVKVTVSTSEIDVGNCADTSNNRITIRRAGRYVVGAFCRLDNLADGKSIVVGIGVGGTVVARGQGMSSLATGAVGTAALCPLVLAAGDQVEVYVYHDNVSSINTAAVADSYPRIFLTEVL